MPHSSEVTWGDFSNRLARESRSILNQITIAEELYQDMLEVFQYAGGTAQALADQLFGKAAGQATAEELAKTNDLIAAATAMHELFQCLNNVDTTASDRAAELRRMS